MKQLAVAPTALFDRCATRLPRDVRRLGIGRAGANKNANPAKKLLWLGQSPLTIIRINDTRIYHPTS